MPPEVPRRLAGAALALVTLGTPAFAHPGTSGDTTPPAALAPDLAAAADTVAPPAPPFSLRDQGIGGDQGNGNGRTLRDDRILRGDRGRPVRVRRPIQHEADEDGAGRPCPRSNGHPITEAPGHGRTVALTFDDGPSAATPGVLRALAAEQVHATFFQIGRQAAADPAMVHRVAAGGHLLADHSWSHRYPAQVNGGWSGAFLRDEMRRTDAALHRAAGVRVCWFRPPGGFDPSTLAAAARAEHLRVALWSVDTRDWADQTTSRIVRAALAGVGSPHPIVLMHDGGGPRSATVAAVESVIRGYRAHGYRFVRLDGRS